MSSFRNGKHIQTMRIEKTDDGNWHPLFCCDCGNIILRHNGDVIASVPGDSPIDLGFEVICKNRNCGKVVIVEGFSVKQTYESTNS